MKLFRIPTGIDTFDSCLQGGLPPGSLVLILSEIGAGDFEFVFTSCANLLTMNKNGDANIKIPEKVCYISFTSSKEIILKEVAFSFPAHYEVLYNSTLQKQIDFKDFSDAYFAKSFIPAAWSSSAKTEPSLQSLRWNEEETNLIQVLIEYLDKNANENLVVIDSLTALAQYCLERMEWKDLILFLRGLQKVSKKWNGLIYAILSEGIFDRNKQEEISECMDGVVVFEWEKLGPTQRQRIMYLKKFRGILPALNQADIVNFETIITPQKGFEISNIKRVRGR